MNQMKTDNLYTIESGLFTVNIDPECDVFAGHFPGRPVLPGAYTLAILKDCTERLIKRKTLFTHIAQCKFTGMVDPLSDSSVDVKISVKCINDQLLEVNANVMVSGTERVILKFKGRCSG